MTAVGQRTDRRKTVLNVYGTLSLNKGRKWGYTIPDVKRQDLDFPADKKPPVQIFFFDANTTAQVINAAVQPFKLMCLVAALCGLRIGEVAALKVTNLDFERKRILITGALDYATRKETLPKARRAPLPSTCPSCSRSEIGSISTMLRMRTAISSSTRRPTLSLRKRNPVWRSSGDEEAWN